MLETLTHLTQVQPPRNHKNIDSLNKIANYLKNRFDDIGLDTSFQEFEINENIYKNVIATLNPQYEKRLIIGAHYDVCGNTQGADDNASAIAGVIQTAIELFGIQDEIPFRIDFLCFTLEEHPYFGTQNMGSYKYAKYLFDNKVDVIGMINYEMIGYFTSNDVDLEQFIFFITKSQANTSKGNYIASLSDEQSVNFLSKFDFMNVEKNIEYVEAMIPTPLNVITASDHLNFWKFGYSAIMITDTAHFRNPNYHTLNDTLETLDIKKMQDVISLVVNGIKNLIFEIYKSDKYLNKLANIYIDNCGISIGYRTIAFDMATNYFEEKYKIDFGIAVKYFELIMDEIDIAHREYDITFYKDETEYKNLKKEFILKHLDNQ